MPQVFAGITAGQVFFFVLKVAMLYAAYRLSEPENPLDTKRATDIRTSRRSGNEPWRVIYGEARVGGIFVFMHQGDTMYTTPPTPVNHQACLNVVMVMASHRIKSIGQMYFDDEAVPLDGNGDCTDSNSPFFGLVHVEKRLGSHATTFPDLITETAASLPGGTDKWTSDHKLLDRAHVWIQFDMDRGEVFGGSLPNITFDVEGHDNVYDPRGPSYGYTQNASLCLADYTASDSYGIGGGYNTIDETALIAAANICDEDVVLDDLSTEDRYTCNGVLTMDDTRGTNAGKILKAMGGIMSYTEGQWRILPATWRAPVLEFTEDDLVAPIRIVPRSSKRDLFNAVKGLFISGDLDNIPTDYPPVRNTTYRTEDGEELFLELDQEMCTSPATSQRLGKIALERARQQITVIFPGKLACYQAQTGDTISLTIDRYGWASKEFEVSEANIAIEPGDGNQGPTISCELTLRETAEAVFDWANGEETTFDLADDTYLSSPYAPSPPTNLVVLSDDTTAVWVTGVTFIPAILLTWDAPAAANQDPLMRYEVQWKDASSSTWSQTITVDPTMNEYLIENVVVGVLTDVRIRLMNIAGKVSAWVADQVTPTLTDDDGGNGDNLVYGGEYNDPEHWILAPELGGGYTEEMPDSSAMEPGQDNTYYEPAKAYDVDENTFAQAAHDPATTVPEGDVHGVVYSWPASGGAVIGNFVVKHLVVGGNQTTDYQTVWYSINDGVDWVYMGKSLTGITWSVSLAVTVTNRNKLRLLVRTTSGSAVSVNGYAYHVKWNEISSGAFAQVADNKLTLRGDTSGGGTYASATRAFPGRATDPNYVVPNGQTYRTHLEINDIGVTPNADILVQLLHVSAQTYYDLLTIPFADVTAGIKSHSNIWTAPAALQGPFQIVTRSQTDNIVHADKLQVNWGSRLWPFKTHIDEVVHNPDYRSGRRQGYPGGRQTATNKTSEVS